MSKHTPQCQSLHVIHTIQKSMTWLDFWNYKEFETWMRARSPNDLIHKVYNSWFLSEIRIRLWVLQQTSRGWTSLLIAISWRYFKNHVILPLVTRCYMVLWSMKGLHLETKFVDLETSNHPGGGQVVRPCNPCTPLMVFRAGDSWHSSKIIRVDEKNAVFI